MATRRPSKKIIKLPKVKAGKIDFQFLGIIIILLSFGLIMVLSASSPVAYSSSMTGYDSFYFFKKQLIWALFGGVLMFLTSNFEYRKLKRWGGVAAIVSFVLLVAVLIPGIGVVVNDARRWIQIGPINFQPSEVAKFGVVLFMAESLSRNHKILKKFGGLMYYLVILGIFAGVIMLEPHFSCTMLIMSSAAIMLFASGARWKHIGILAIPIVLVVVVLVISAPYRLARVTTFLDPFKDIQGEGWQIVQSLYAIGSGGVFGAGIGQSRQKYLNIPEPQNDFIFSIICEELGLFGAILVIALFIFLVYRGLKIALNAPDLFGTLLVLGIISLIAIQALVNIAVVTSSMPVTGMPLPFFSYGGTALAITMAEMGVVLNVSKYGADKHIGDVNDIEEEKKE
ncbi:MAG: putative lipid II flippase FtsW [Ruminococcaceae bacterium]|nr:putative lipid II flippase FtsW [Oscillospiraceae bacterium]